MPVTISIANSKGGVGKTTTAMGLAAELKRMYPQSDVMLADMDKQGSATKWAKMARDAGDPLPFKVSLANIQSVSWLAEELPNDGFLIIDTAPGDSAVMDAAIRASHFVIVPTGPSGMDMDRMWETLGLLTSHQKMHAVLVTQARLNTNQLADALQVLDTTETSRFNTIITNLQRYPKEYGTNPARDRAYGDVAVEIVNALSTQMEAAQ
ncbi:ParA family protein [Gordonia sihwensis]|uniref:ParA family protein n=1 Tax=Gordonia sihwensis TaxID=173559 RepID=UPI003D972527